VVSSVDGGWSVRRTGAAKASRKFTTQQEAVRYGKELAKKEQSELYVHRKDGTIVEHSTYRNARTSQRDAR